MKKFYLVLSIVLWCMPKAEAFVFNFDDVYEVQRDKSFFNQEAGGSLWTYNELRFDTFDYFKKGAYPFPTVNSPVNGFTSGVTSGNYAVGNYWDGGNTHIFYEDFRRFTFNGASFTSGYWDNQYLNIQGLVDDGFGNETVGYDETFLITAYQPTRINVHMPDLIGLQIAGYQGPLPGQSGPETNMFDSTVGNASVVIDDFTINEEMPSSAVPEPASLFLLGGGLLGALIRQRLKR